MVGDPLPSWNDGPSKAAIVHFVSEVTREGGPLHVPPEQRIAAFAKDLTYQPMVELLGYLRARGFRTFLVSGDGVGIHARIGRRPILAFGNADGDLPMMEYTEEGAGPRLMLVLHHDNVGKLDRALDQARERRWTVVSMKTDFVTVFRTHRQR